MDLRNFLFANRSYTPIPIVIPLIYFSRIMVKFSLFGILLIIVGELIRLNAVRYAGGRTRTTKVGAPSLCTTGPYARIRNPLYVGNLIIYCGIIFFAGGPYMLELLIIVFLFFTFQYSMIIDLEEEKLEKLFDIEYVIYKNNVPKLIPRYTPWINNNKIEPSTIKQTLKIEKRTLQNLLLMVLCILGKSLFL